MLGWPTDLGCVLSAVLGLCMLCCIGCGSQPDEIEVLWESFEQQVDWAIGRDRANPRDAAQQLERTDVGATDGSHALRCGFAVDGWRPATFYTDQIPEPDWSAERAVLADVTNESDAVIRFCLLLESGPERKEQESSRFVLQPKAKQTLRFKLQGQQRKGPPKDWQPEDFAFQQLQADDIRRVGFRVYGEAGATGTVLIDNVRQVRWADGGSQDAS